MIDVVDNDAEYYYHYDGLGSVVALSDSNGDTVQTYEYSVYGQVAASDPNFLTNPYMFTGRRFDIETGLYYYRARYYNPHIGRFMQTDPVGYDDGINWYLYCGNNPLAFVDPSGLFQWSARNIGKDASIAWQDVRDYTEEQRNLAEAETISDVKALAQIANEVAEWSKRWYLPKGVETFMFVRGLAELLCRETMSLIPPGREDNPNQIGGFGDPNGTFNDTGFKVQYQEGGSNQVDHFVAYLQAGYYLGYYPALAFLYGEEGNTDSSDWRLGERGAIVGTRLAISTAIWPLNRFGIPPSGVGQWIMENLADPFYTHVIEDE